MMTTGIERGSGRPGERRDPDSLRVVGLPGTAFLASTEDAVFMGPRVREDDIENDATSRRLTPPIQLSNSEHTFAIPRRSARGACPIRAK
jgi:hypothetical protein